jgi:hypothetical protein
MLRTKRLSCFGLMAIGCLAFAFSLAAVANECGTNTTCVKADCTKAAFCWAAFKTEVYATGAGSGCDCRKPLLGGDYACRGSLLVFSCQGNVDQIVVPGFCKAYDNPADEQDKFCSPRFNEVTFNDVKTMTLACKDDPFCSGNGANPPNVTCNCEGTIDDMSPNKSKTVCNCRNCNPPL